MIGSLRSARIFNKKSAAVISAMVTCLLFSAGAAAQATGLFDTSTATGVVDSAKITMTEIGLALLGAAALAMGIRWTKATFF